MTLTGNETWWPAELQGGGWEPPYERVFEGESKPVQKRVTLLPSTLKKHCYALKVLNTDKKLVLRVHIEREGTVVFIL